MKQLTCEMCGSTELIKQEGFFVCQTCGTKYSIEEAKKLMVEGTVKVDNSDRIKNYLELARTAKDEDDSGLMLPIEELDLSARTANALLNNDIRTIRDLVTLSETDLKDLKGFGQKALDEVKEKLTELNI